METDDKFIYMPHTIKGDKIEIGGWGKFQESSRVLTRAEASYLFVILMNFLQQQSNNENENSKICP